MIFMTQKESVCQVPALYISAKVLALVQQTQDYSSSEASLSDSEKYSVSEADSVTSDKDSTGVISTSHSSEEKEQICYKSTKGKWK